MGRQRKSKLHVELYRGGENIVTVSASSDGGKKSS